MGDIDDSPVRIRCEDGFELRGVLLRPPEPELAVLVAPATGVRSRLYLNFARALTEAGAACLLYDNRGIGDSAPAAGLRGFEADLVSWGQLDFGAAVRQLEAALPGLPLAMVGHSAGAQLIGLSPEVLKLERILQVNASTGYIGKLAPSLRVLGPLLLRGWLPVTGALLGYGAAKITGWGENLPRGVARQWGEWCSRPGYVENAFGKGVEAHWYGEVTAPILNISAADDPIATPENVADLLRLFPKAPTETRVWQPADYGFASIGHIDAFRRKHQALWPEMMGWLLGRELSATVKGGGAPIIGEAPERG